VRSPENTEPPELTEVIARLAALLGPRSGTVRQLDRGITHRSYRVTFGGTDYAVQLSGKRSAQLGIDRESECLANTRAGELGIAPPVAAMLHDPHCLVTAFPASHPVEAAELSRPERLTEVARALRAFHDSGLELPSSFDSFEVVERYAGLATGLGRELPSDYGPVLERARTVRRAFRGADGHGPVPCHNDLITANLIAAEGRLLIADWEYAGMGDPFFELANLSANNGLGREAEERLLEIYLGQPATPGQKARIMLMRFMSDFREAMWGIAQDAISEVPEVDFGDYAARHFQRLRATDADPRFETSLAEVSAS